jgi:hypothetical protein
MPDLNRPLAVVLLAAMFCLDFSKNLLMLRPRLSFDSTDIPDVRQWVDTAAAAIGGLDLQHHLQSVRRGRAIRHRPEGGDQIQAG